LAAIMVERPEAAAVDDHEAAVAETAVRETLSPPPLGPVL
jgi:hypothetical protein